MKKSRMFSIVKTTWNPVTGCLHDCKYCWAKRLAETRLKRLDRYSKGFIPVLNNKEFKKKFSSGVVFVCSMGDLFGEFIPEDWIKKVIEHTSKFHKATFLFLTKNPRRLKFFDFPKNTLIGSTIETDLDDIYNGISKAPRPSERIKEMIELNWESKFVSVEPVIKFSEQFFERICKIEPKIVYVGYDNYGNQLPEPRLSDTKNLISELREVGIDVIEKKVREAWDV